MSDLENIERKTWNEFINSGLLWWVNRSLIVFGWIILCEQNGEGRITNIYPARCRYRGFPPLNEQEGFKKLASYIRGLVEELEKEVT